MIFDVLTEKIGQKGNPTCVGLDIRREYLPEELLWQYGEDQSGIAAAILAYNREIMDAVAEYVPSVKAQIACYEQYGPAGMKAFADTLAYAKSLGLVAIADAKRNDIASTAADYAHAFLGGAGQPAFDCDILTVNPYLGYDGIGPFLDSTPEKGVFALVKTSNPSSRELQDLVLQDGRTVYEAVGALVEKWGQDTIGQSGYSRIGAVVGATHPRQGRALRAAMPNTFFLLPGYGTQGGTALDAAGMFDRMGGGAIVNNSRGIVGAWMNTGRHYVDVAVEKVKLMRDDLRAALKLSDR